MRPKYHFTPSRNWLSDPNGLVHDGRSWHLFYQYNPHGEDWGHMSWGHATSADLAQWAEHAPALVATGEQMAFSGSAVVDEQDTSGFGAGAMVAVYTAARTGDDEHQAQALAYSSDGMIWQEFDGNPVLDLGLANFRDPYVFRHEATHCWVMIVVKSTEQIAQIYRSPDLKSWSLASEIEAGDSPGRVWECPTLVELPVAGTGTSKWFFKVDALFEAPGAGALFLTGDFNGHQFVPDGAGWRVLDQGRDFYAAVAWNGPRDDRGRPAWIGWMGNHSYQHEFPKRGWRGVMSIPRRLSLVEKDGIPVLSQEIEPSVAALFSKFEPMPDNQVTLPIACRIRIEADCAAPVLITDAISSRFTIEPHAQEWRIARSDTALPFLGYETSIRREAGMAIEVWIDSETIEVIASDGTQCASFQHRPKGPRLTASCNAPSSIAVAALL